MMTIYRYLAAGALTVALLAPTVAQAVTVQHVRIDATTRGDWRDTYGACFALLPQAFPEGLVPEQEVGPFLWNPDQSAFGQDFDPDYANYRNADPNDGLLNPPSNVCVSGDGVPLADPTASFEFRLFSQRRGVEANAFAFGFVEDDGDGIAEQYEVKAGSSQWVPCLNAFRPGTFDNEAFARDPLSGEVVIRDGGDATVAFYFLTAQRSCRAQAWELYWIDPADGVRRTLATSASTSLPIRDLADGKYLVVELLDIPPGATIGLDTEDLTPGAGEICADPQAVASGVNSVLSGIFIDGTETCEPLLASLGDFVWEDRDGDGVQDAGEPGVPGVTVNLLRPGDDGVCATGDETPFASDTTDLNGAYLFDGLLAGAYCVEFVKPDGYACTLANQGVDDTADSDVVDRGDGTCQTDDPAQDPISLMAGENDLTWDAGLIRPASLGDFVWEDLDRDGIQDADEPGINGVTVNLTDCAGNAVTDASGLPIPSTMTATDSDGVAGSYGFTNLRPGCYVVEFALPSGFFFTVKNAPGSTPADDSNVNPSGFSDPVDLASGEDDPTIDAGLFRQQGLGDFLWHDLNSNGIQEANEPGIGGVTVTLYAAFNGDCTDQVIATDTTDANGEYGFAPIPGDYCVGFDRPADLCRFGDAVFTTPNAGVDPARDSDADAAGLTGVIDLAAGETDTTWDAGVYCPAKLGDRLWDDRNANGVQDNGEPGIPGATVRLLTCGDVVLDSTTTTGGGIYSFIVDPSQDYRVQFVSPDGKVFTLQGAGDDPTVDSDADPLSGSTACITDIVSNSFDDTWDAGVIDIPECGLTVSKSCEVVQPFTGTFDCDSKLDALTMIWNGPGTLTGVTAYAGDIGSDVLPAEINGDEVTVSGYRAAGAPNDVVWVYTYTDDAGNAFTGQSVFHLSCSDDAMDGPEDCGLPQGDGKSNDSDFANDWLLEGLVTEQGTALDCTTSPQTSGTDCEIQSVLASCEIIDKPASLTFLYTGGDCDDSDNAQDPSKATCSGAVNGTDVTVIVDNNDDPPEADGDYLVDPTVVALNDAFTVTASDSSFDSQTYYQLTDEAGNVQLLGIHTSCSQPLAVGDVFGGLTLVAINGVGLGKDVLYSYLVSNDGDQVISNITVEDDILGAVEGSPITQLVPGDSRLLTELAFVTATTTNTVVVEGEVTDRPRLVCAAQDSRTVTVLPPPPCEVAIAFDKLEDAKIKWKLSNTGVRLATVGSLTLIWPIEQGDIKKVKFDGDIFVGPLSGTPTGDGRQTATIAAGDWIPNELDRRQLSIGDEQTLEVEFSVKYDGDTPDDYTLVVNFEEGCSVSFSGLPPALSCEDGDPTALVFEYTGDACDATTNDQEGKFECTETGVLRALESVEMTKDASKFEVTFPSVDRVRITYVDKPGDSFPSEIKYDIHATETQSHALHTSCSKPLAVGDQFGAFILREFYTTF